VLVYLCLLVRYLTFSSSTVSTSAFFSQQFANLRFCKFGMRFARIASADKVGEAALGKQQNFKPRETTENIA
jgi:hypothetical protein